LKLKELLIVAGIALVVGILFFQEDVRPSHADYRASSYNFVNNKYAYDLQHPKMRWDLPNHLQEISGLSYYQKDQLACVQDEKGILYIYDLHEQKIVMIEKFGEDGDYEGVEIVDGIAYVLKSNGVIYYFKPGDKKVEKIKTGLTRKNDTEGLAFQKSTSELLIACKENPGIPKEKLSKARAIYRIDIKEKSFDEKHRYLINNESFHKMLAKKELNKNMHMPFKPSGLAVHPETSHIFVIASVGKLLVILDAQGNIIDMIPLDPTVFLQPEGITFSPSGDLYISSEGRGGKGYILKF
jgi:uncharacterized protein YjiK